MLKHVESGPHIRNFGAVVVVLTALIVGADFQVGRILPPAAIVLSGYLYSSVDETHHLPDGSRHVILGLGFAVAGLSAVTSSFRIVGSVLSLGGIFLACGGLTRMQLR